jgi:hypothetical protein
MGTARIMTLEEVMSCNHAYVLYDPDDPMVYFFQRIETAKTYVHFGRKLRDYVTCEPHLLISEYKKKWVAFTEMPGYYQIRIAKDKMYGREKRQP